MTCHHRVMMPDCIDCVKEERDRYKNIIDELLEAFKELIAVYKEDQEWEYSRIPEKNDPYYQKAMKAIAKAEGREP